MNATDRLLYQALHRMVNTPTICSFLRDNKPSVLEQAERALARADADEAEMASHLDRLAEEHHDQLEHELAGAREWDFVVAVFQTGGA